MHSVTPLQKVILFYTIIVIVLGVLGYYKGPEFVGSNSYGAAAGATLGMVLSLILWFMYGKNYVASTATR